MIYQGDRAMTYTGVVKDGKIELPPEVKLPEGASVQVELLPKDEADEWIKEWDKMAKEIAEAWQSPLSAVEIVAEGRE
jgi:hypothetical protein